jgi:FtsP/CotA-like multicopper oxidase with cupredoxin domain
MKKTNGRISNHGERALPARKALLIAASFIVAAVAAAGAFVALSLRAAPAARAESPLPAAQNLGSRMFFNPLEIRSRAGEKRLRAIMQIVSGKLLIPNVGMETLRQYRGWDAFGPMPLFGGTISPGPTLRARLGDQVQISFLNKTDDSMFPYSFETNSPGGLSSFGCDKVDNTGTGKSPYPANDKFPNCFHGSSTANIHFHGTHTSPDGLSDNVLVQVLPQPNQPDWSSTFNGIFNTGRIPQKWLDMPANYRKEQFIAIVRHDEAAAAAAAKNNLPPPLSLTKKNTELIAAGQWPQYFMGAFPNFFEIPDYSTGKYGAGQAPGTQWYHAHKHGSTSLHILNGLAGAFIIESSQVGGYDHVIRGFYGWGDSYGEHEKIMVFQQYDATQNLERVGGEGKGIKQVLVNGQLTPTLTMRPGEVQLWRLVNATEGNSQGIIKVGTAASAFKTTGFGFRQTAQDGVQFSPVNYAAQPFLSGKVSAAGLVLAAGNRADLLVQAPQKTGVTEFKNGGATLFFVNVVGPPVNLAEPFPSAWAKMPPFLKDLRPPGANDVTNPGSPVKFQWEAGRTRPGPNPNPPHFMINNKQFGETGDVIDQCMPLGGLQDWVLENYTTSIPHPFHIHINPFQVVKIETPDASGQYATYAPPDNFVWQDVIAIPPARIVSGAVVPGRVTIRQTYQDFVGTFVLHCHILAHEDRGMMQLVRVVPAANYPSGCQKAVPAHH